MKTYLILDYETRSEADLKKVGAWEYSVHPTTEILCVSWRYGTKKEVRKQKSKVWCPLLHGKKPPAELVLGLCEAYRRVAHNALFEQCITANVLLRPGLYFKKGPIPSCPAPSLWDDTAAMAAVLALPRNLEGACQAYEMDVQKDMEGRRLMLKMAKPRRATKNNQEKWHQTEDELKRLMQYCARDVDAETELYFELPRLSPLERKIWLHNQRMNLSGFRVDRPLVKKILKLIAIETKNLNKETVKLTGGVLENVRSPVAVKNYLLKEHGFKLKNLQAKTVDDLIKSGMVEGEARRLLEIRQAISKTSTAKYVAMEMRSRSDSKVRDILLFAAASTKREGGMGVQPQNFPRGIQGLDAWQAAEIVRHGDLETIRLLYGDPMTLFASLLRAMIVADPGMKLHCADYAAIETHVLFWIANHMEGLKALFERRDLYTEMASFIYNMKLAEIGKESRERFVGKQVILGCGYMMSGKKFRTNIILLTGIDLGKSLSDHAVKTYRRVHKPVVKLWSNIEKAAMAAVKYRGKRFKINRVAFYCDDRFLHCELPSGERISYYGPKLQWGMTHWGERKLMLYHWGTNSKTKKWEFAPTYGGKLVENIVQSISRDLMLQSSLKLVECGYTPILHVHDENLSQCPDGKGKQEEFQKIMATVPPWARGLPVRVEGWEGYRYKK